MPQLELNAGQDTTFPRDGFVLLPKILDNSTVDALRLSFDRLFHGEFETGIRPDEVNWQQGSGDPSLTRQICNGWRADRTIAATVGRADFGKAVAKLMGWPGTRIMIDNILWKPPGAKSLGFHQDNSYLAWLTPCEIASLWLALDDVTDNSGTMELIPGSHRWSHAPPTAEFHAPDDYRAPVREAAAREAEIAGGDEPLDVDAAVTTVEVESGAGSIHHGWTWHGSGPNRSSTPRRALVIHAMSSDAVFRPDRFDRGTGVIYSKHATPGTTTMPESVFPITWRHDGYRSAVLAAGSAD